MARELRGGNEPSAAPRWALAAIVALASLAAALAVGVALLLARRPAADFSEAQRQARQRQLEALSPGVFDTFPDPEVGRLLQASLRERAAFGSSLRTNRFGWRERDFAVPRPPGTTRILLLGDSFVFGAGVEEAQRPGAFLERFLRQRGVPSAEVLQLGVSSWNIESEVAYARRSLASVDPQLLVHVVVSNDLDDTSSARGFGAAADFTSQHPERAAMLWDFFPIWGLGRGFHQPSLLNAALGYEGRSRHLANRDRIDRLAAAMRARGGRYLLVMNWESDPRTAERYLARGRDQESVAHVSNRFRHDLRFRISNSDPHWSAGGGEEIGRYLYGAIIRRHLLPGVPVSPWAEAEATFDRIDGDAVAELAQGADEVPDRLAALRVEDLDQTAAQQIYAGVYADGTVAPYASVLLHTADARRVRVTGEALAAPELEGLRVAVFGDDVRLGELVLHAGQRFSSELPLPRAADDMDIRFVTDDWVYAPRDLRHCIAWRLASVSAEP